MIKEITDISTAELNKSILCSLDDICYEAPSELQMANMFEEYRCHQYIQPNSRAKSLLLRFLICVLGGYVALVIVRGKFNSIDTRVV